VLDYGVLQVRSRPHRPARGVFDEGARRTVDKAAVVKGKFDTEILLRRRGELVLPVHAEVRFTDGTARQVHWDGGSRWHRIEYLGQPELDSVRIDPQGKVPLDVNLLDNERSLRPRRGPVAALAARVLGWAQLVVGMVGF
jgi:hypothetical protein